LAIPRKDQLSNPKLKVGPAGKPLSEIPGFQKEGAPWPLWFYILAEAQELRNGTGEALLEAGSLWRHS